MTANGFWNYRLSFSIALLAMAGIFRLTPVFAVEEYASACASWKKRILLVCAYLGPAVSGFGGFAMRAEAQNAAPAFSRSASIADSTTQGADWIADEKLRIRVKAALHDDPHFYDDEHITVSVEKGAVVLRGSSSAIGICETRCKPPGRLPVTDK